MREKTLGREEVRIKLTNSEQDDRGTKKQNKTKQKQSNRTNQKSSAPRACTAGVKIKLAQTKYGRVKTNRNKDKASLPRCGGAFLQGGGSVGSISEGILGGHDQ